MPQISNVNRRKNLSQTPPDPSGQIPPDPSGHQAQLLGSEEWPTVSTLVHIEGLRELMTFRSAEVQCRVVTRWLVVTYDGTERESQAYVDS